MRKTIRQDLFKAKAPQSPIDQYTPSGFVPHQRGPKVKIGDLGSTPVDTGPSFQRGTFRPTLGAPKPLVDPVTGKVYTSSDNGYLDYLNNSGTQGGGGGGISDFLGVPEEIKDWKKWPPWLWLALAGGSYYLWMNRNKGKK